MWGQAEWKRGCWLRIGKLGRFCTALETLVGPATAGYWVYFPGTDIWLIITFSPQKYNCTCLVCASVSVHISVWRHVCIHLCVHVSVCASV